MTTQELKEHNRYAFEVFCKTVLRNKARNIHKKINRTEQCEIFFADIPIELETQQWREDEYDLDKRIAINSSSNGFLIEDKSLAAALTVLLPKYREVLFLSYFMEHSDREIGSD